MAAIWARQHQLASAIQSGSISQTTPQGSRNLEVAAGRHEITGALAETLGKIGASGIAEKHNAAAPREEARPVIQKMADLP